MASFNYTSPAELYTSRRYAKSANQQYRRFATAAAAIKQLVEDTPQVALAGSVLEVDEQRYVGAEILRLYEAADYPLDRRQ